MPHRAWYDMPAYTSTALMKSIKRARALGIVSEAAFTPYYALTERDRGRPDLSSPRSTSSSER